MLYSGDFPSLRREMSSERGQGGIQAVDHEAGHAGRGEIAVAVDDGEQHMLVVGQGFDIGGLVAGLEQQ